MTETALTEAQALALSGTTDADNGMVYPTVGEREYYTTMHRVLHKLSLLGKVPGNELRVYKDGALTFGVRAGLYMDRGTGRSYAGASAQALTDDDTNYIYLTPAGTLTVNVTGFPAGAHIPLATILAADAAYAYTDITDYRGRNLNRIPAHPFIVVAASDAPDDVKAMADYVCDGTADDVEINAAIAALPGTGIAAGAGGVVYLSGGTFTIAAAIEVKGGMILEGEGIYATTLQLAADTAIDAIIGEKYTDTRQPFFCIRDLLIHGNRDNQSGAGSNGIYFPTGGAEGYIDVYIERVFVSGCKKAGIDLKMGWGLKLRQCVVEYCTSWGVYIRGSNANISACKIMDNDRSQLWLYGAGNSVVTGNEIMQSADAYSTDSCVVAEISDGLVFTNNVLRQQVAAEGYGLRLLKSDGCTISGNSIGIATAEKPAILIEDTSPVCEGNVISGNVLRCDRASTVAIDPETTELNEYHGNAGMSAGEERVIEYAKNTNADTDTIAAGDVVALKAVAAGNEVIHTNTGGDDLVYGMALEEILSTAFGRVLTVGPTAILKANGAANIAIGSFLSAHTTDGIAKVASAGDTAFAISRAVHEADSTVAIAACLIRPRKVGAVV